MSYLRKIRAIGNFFGLSIFRKKWLTLFFISALQLMLEKIWQKKKKPLHKKIYMWQDSLPVSAFSVSGLLED